MTLFVLKKNSCLCLVVCWCVPFFVLTVSQLVEEWNQKHEEFLVALEMEKRAMAVSV